MGEKYADCNSLESHSLKSTNNGSDSKDQSDEKVFVNHAAFAWEEMRRQWVGNQSQRSQRMPREPVLSDLQCVINASMSWNATYEDLLLSTTPFHRPIPLAEMVDFLVDIWHEECLFD